jgi:hypothetical protein
MIARLTAVVAALAAAAIVTSCQSGAECTWDTDCPGRQVCSADNLCADSPDGGGPAGGPDAGGAGSDAGRDTGHPQGDGGRDAGDAGHDAGRDAGDAGPADAGDAGSLDAGDAGHPDAGDAGYPDTGDAGCAPECAAAWELACDGLHAYHICTKGSDGCLVWGPQVSCDSQDECRQGLCGRDRCTEKDSRCRGAQSYELCSYNGTPFLGWGQAIACGPGEQCTRSICCPPDMAEAPGFCTDKCEAFAAAQPDCVGQVYGRDADDYPAGFPDRVGDGGLPETQKVYACTAAAVKPSAFITFFQAKRACENSGKRLCTAAEWYAACTGPGDLAFPYGAQYQAGTCNTETSAIADCGVSGGCVSGYGAFDMSGNLFEWVLDDGSPPAQQPIVGGAYNSGVSSSCATQYTVSSVTHSGARGWRCCR